MSTKQIRAMNASAEQLAALPVADLVLEIERLRAVLKDSQRANQSKRKRVTALRHAFRVQHINFKAVLASRSAPRPEEREK